MLANFFKPKWQHKDAKVRIQALSTLAGDSVELIKLAQTDPDENVRTEAIMRLNHLPTLIQIGHTTGSVAEKAKQRVIGLSSSDHKHDHLLADVFAWLQNPALIRSIARDSERGNKLRRLALDQIDDQELLYDIALHDNLKDIQFQAAQRIEDLEKLKTLDKQHGKNNKRLRQLLKERLDHIQQRQQLEDQITHLCAEAETLGKTKTWEQDKTRMRVLQQSWQPLAKQASVEQQTRFQTALDDFQQRLQQHEQHEQRVRPLREARQEILAASTRLLKQLQDAPEVYTLESLDTELSTLHRRWSQQESLPSPEQEQLEKQWQAAYERLRHLRTSLADDLQAIEKLTQLAEKADSLRRQDKPVQSKLVLSLQSDWTNSKRPHGLRSVLAELEQSFHRSMDALNARLDKQKAQRDSMLKSLREELQALEHSLETEQYSDAITQHQAFLQRLKETPDLPASDLAFFQRRIQMLTPYIRELQDWRRWGTDQARKQLIETAEHLRSDDDIDPQERAKQVQNLRSEWRKLAHMEPGQQRTLWKTFDATVTAAYEPSKQHFTEQAQQREANLDQRNALCAQLENLNTQTSWENPDWRELQTQVNQVRKQWKEAGTVSHKSWKSVNNRFNAAMDALEEHFKRERARNWQAREQLVEQAQKLLEMKETSKAVEQAKQLQGQWQITLASRPADEQRLWKQFREPIDGLFARIREERQQKREAYQAQLAEAARLEAEKQQQALERKQRKLDELTALAEQSVLNKQADPDAATEHTNQTTGERLCLQLEILLGLETPAEFHQARLEYQIAQMRDAMRSRKEAQSPVEQAIPLLKQWYKLGGMPTDALADQQARIEAISAGLTQSL